MYQPSILLSALACTSTARRLAGGHGHSRVPVGWAAFCTSAIVFQVVMIASWIRWTGGHCWGSRLVLEIVPLWHLLCLQPIALLIASRRSRFPGIRMTLLGALVQIPYVYGDGIRWNTLVDSDRHPEAVYSWTRAPFLLPFTGTALR